MPGINKLSDLLACIFDSSQCFVTVFMINASSITEALCKVRQHHLENSWVYRCSGVMIHVNRTTKRFVLFRHIASPFLDQYTCLSCAVVHPLPKRLNLLNFSAVGTASLHPCLNAL